MKYETLLDAACHFYRAGYRWDAEAARFVRGSWHGYLVVLKNGKCRTRAS